MSENHDDTDDVGVFTEQLVDAFHRQAADEVQGLLARLADVQGPIEVDDSGSLVEWDGIPSPDDEDQLSLFAHLLDEDRLEALENGEPLTSDEADAWTRAAVEEVLTGDVDSDVYPTWCVALLKDKAARSAVVAWLVYGYSVSGITIRPVGVFADQAQALAAVKQLGITSLDDYERFLKQKGTTSRTANGKH